MEVLSNASGINFSRWLYEHDFPDWFIVRAGTGYQFNWDAIFLTLRNGKFFFPDTGYFGMPTDNILNRYLPIEEARQIGEEYLQRLLALASTVSQGESVGNSLQLDGYAVNTETVSLVPFDRVVNAEQEADALTSLVKNTGISDSSALLKHIADSKDLFVSGKYHPSLNEARNVLQALVDSISTDTENSKGHATKLPGGTANRIAYLKQIGFFSEDEEGAFKSAWGALSAGSHPGVPARDEARIGLILALEFGQILLLKFGNWKANSYKKFS